ncbi:MAG: glycosyltransferase family 4 protein [Anaerolineaceae bacterium]|nr:glycosyltransferase family 4 protein [Anaerolineaceae bacterium]
MRILYLMQYFVSPEGAWSTRTYEFARRLAGQGHDVYVITSNAMMPGHQNIKRVVEVDIDGITCIIIPSLAPYAEGISFRRRIRSYIQFNSSAFRQILRYPADIVYVSSPPLPISLPGIWAKFRHRARMVFEVRDLWPELPIAVGALKNPILRVLARGLEWVTYHLSTHIIALSPGMAEGVAQRGIPEDRISIIPNCSDIAFFNQVTEPATIRPKLGISEQDALVVYAGAFGLLNDVEYLVDVAHHMTSINPNVHFLLVGSGVNRDAIIEKAKALGIYDTNVHIWKAVPKTAMPDLLAAATVVTSLIVPLEPMWKNSANKFFDGLAARKPMAINYGGWQAELLLETGAGIVMKPGDPQQGAQQLAEFISDPERLQKASEASYVLAQTRFDRERMAEELENILINVMQKTR